MMGLPDVIQDNRNDITNNRNKLDEMARMHDQFLTRVKSIEDQHNSSVKI